MSDLYQERARACQDATAILEAGGTTHDAIAAYRNWVDPPHTPACDNQRGVSFWHSVKGGLCQLLYSIVIAVGTCVATGIGCPFSTEIAAGLPAEAGTDATTATGSAATEAAGTGGIETTAHGAERIAGAAATRGGVLGDAEIAVVRGGGTAYTQGNGAIARVLQQADGRFSVVVDGDRGLITTFRNLSQSSLNRLAKNYDWKLL